MVSLLGGSGETATFMTTTALLHKTKVNFTDINAPPSGLTKYK